MRLIHQIIAITLVISTLSGCSLFSGDEDSTSIDGLDYTQAEMSGNLDVPESVGKDNSQDLFVVPPLLPESTGVVYGNDADIMAPMQILSLGSDVRVNRDVQTASAFVNADELKIWDVVSRFMQTEQITTSGRGIIEEGVTLTTDWITQYDEPFWWGDDIPDVRHKFRVSVLDAERPNETRLDVDVLAAERYTKDEGWEPKLDDNRAGSEFLNEILGFMYVENIRESRQRVSQSGLAGISVSLGSDLNGNPALVTASSFEQTWDRVPIAMQMVKMRVDDRDRSQRLFFISRNDEDEGFFESLAFWSGDDEQEMNLDKGSYRIQVTTEGERTYIVFTDTDEVPLQADILAQNFAALAKAFKARVKDLNASGGNS